MSGERCSEISLGAHESLVATATTAERWLLVEVPGSWPRDVSAVGALPAAAAAAVATWLEQTPSSRLLFIRRPGRWSAQSLVFVIRSAESSVEVRRIELEDTDELADVDLARDGDRTDQQLVLICGHGSRDTCCALRGTAVYGALAERLGDEELWVSSHQGGHRFAANVLVLPSGLQFGRVEPDEAVSVVARALQGQIELDRYRGRTCYASMVQAAEWAVREARELEGVESLRLTGVEGPVVRFRGRDGLEHSAQVEEAIGPSVPASCGAEPAPQAVFSALVV
ncbi:MAG: sucrase ferredoxin [Actinomycetota bacterium]